MWNSIWAAVNGARMADRKLHATPPRHTSPGGHLRDQEPPGLLGHPEAHGQADEQIQDQQQQIGQPPMRRENKTLV